MSIFTGLLLSSKLFLLLNDALV